MNHEGITVMGGRPFLSESLPAVTVDSFNINDVVIL